MSIIILGGTYLVYKLISSKKMNDVMLEKRTKELYKKFEARYDAKHIDNFYTEFDSEFLENSKYVVWKRYESRFNKTKVEFLENKLKNSYNNFKKRINEKDYNFEIVNDIDYDDL